MEKYFLETELIWRLTSEFEKMYAGNNSESFKRMEYMRPITSTQLQAHCNRLQGTFLIAIRDRLPYSNVTSHSKKYSKATKSLMMREEMNRRLAVITVSSSAGEPCRTRLWD